jgi:S1-C subfamily serine protease
MRLHFTALACMLSFLVSGQELNFSNYKYLFLHYDNEVTKEFGFKDEEIIIPDKLFGNGYDIIARSIPNSSGKPVPKKKVFANLLVTGIDEIADEKPLLIGSIDWNFYFKKNAIDVLWPYFYVKIDFYDSKDLTNPLSTYEVEQHLPVKVRKWNKSMDIAWRELARKLRYLLSSHRYFDANSSVYYYAEIDKTGNEFYQEFINKENGTTIIDSDDFVSDIDSLGITNKIEGIWKSWKRGSNPYCPNARLGIKSVGNNNRVYNANLLDVPSSSIVAKFENTASESLYSAVWKGGDNSDFELFAELSPAGGMLEVMFEDVDQLNCTYIKIYPEVEKEILQNNNVASGSCVLVDNNCGWFITNHHVVENATRLTIEINNEEKEVQVVTSDEANDLALVKLIDKSDISLPKQFAINNKINIGMKVLALGYPKLTHMGEDIKINEGIVSGMTFLKTSTMFQLDASITNGNSGGAVLNEDFELVGISAAGWRPDDNTENVNGAVKSNVVSMLIETMSYTCEDFDKENFFITDLDDAKKAVMIIRAYYDE